MFKCFKRSSSSDKENESNEPSVRSILHELIIPIADNYIELAAYKMYLDVDSQLQLNSKDRLIEQSKNAKNETEKVLIDFISFVLGDPDSMLEDFVEKHLKLLKEATEKEVPKGTNPLSNFRLQVLNKVKELYGDLKGRVKEDIASGRGKNLDEKTLRSQLETFMSTKINMHDLKTSEVPKIIQKKVDGWKVIFAQDKHNIFTKNYIQNGSGEQAFKGWGRNGEDVSNEWLVEVSPDGCDPLPPQSEGESNATSCFVSSFKGKLPTIYKGSSKEYVVDLWEEGLTPTILKITLPLELRCSQMYTARQDCGGKFNWELRLLDSNKKILNEHKSSYQLSPGRKWHKAQHSFYYKASQAEEIADVRYLVFFHESTDSIFWAGHHGIKFARSSVTLRCPEGEPV